MKQTLMLLAILVGLVCHAQQNPEQNDVTVEVVTFRLKPGITPEEGQKKLLQLNEHVMHFEGFIERNLTVSEDGEWADIVHWTSLSHALNAAEQVAKNPEALAFFSVIDESTIAMHHYSLVHKFNK